MLSVVRCVKSMHKMLKSYSENCFSVWIILEYIRVYKIFSIVLVFICFLLRI